MNPVTNVKINAKDTADTFNDFFCNIARKIQSNIKPLNDAEGMRLYGQSSINDTMSHNSSTLDFSNVGFNFGEISYDILKTLIKKIEVHKSSGVDHISASLLKSTFRILIQQFRFLLNLCLDTCIFPDKWKQCLITPLFKAGLQTDPSNYRPVACIPLPGKLLEKCIYTQVYTYLEDNKLLSNMQFGFRSGRSTQHAVFFF